MTIRVFSPIIFFALFFLNSKTSAAQDSAVNRIHIKDISWQDTLSRESANFRDSINATLDSARTLRDVMIGIQDSVNVIRDSVLRDSVSRHWMGWKKI